jgi:hypothetical protein
MASVSRLALRNLAGNARKFSRAPAVQTGRFMSTIIERKEMAEESRFIRSMEVKRQAELKQKMEKILALEDSHEDKKDLLELLGKIIIICIFV